MTGLRTATATNINTFVGGDSIITATTLVGALQEVTELLDIAIFDYNQNNTLLPYPDIDVTYNAGLCAATIPVPYEKVAGVKVPVSYLNAYTDWVVPTTGELAGIANLLGAYLYILNAMTDANDLLRPGVVIQSAKPTTSNTDDNVAKQYATSFGLPFDTVVDAATGLVSKVFQNFHVITDLQQGYPIV
jgi:hypothetical protein